MSKKNKTLVGIGVIGMAVMGRNLALNISSRGYSVAIFNRTKKITQKVMQDNPGKNLIPHSTIKEFVSSLITPRCIFLMVKAGKATDSTITELIPYLNKGDILIDGGNTYYRDTICRNRDLSRLGIHFLGTGFSGGEEGALTGPSIMPGGGEEAYKLVEPLLEEIAAKVDGKPCVTYIGSDGSGHYVKMVHNGIEYGDMQLIAESYSLLKNALCMNNEEIAKTFGEWNKGELNSYLIEITSSIFAKKDDGEGGDNGYLIDKILDKSAHKGTGKWTSQSALDCGIPLTLITASVFARYISSLKSQRVSASKMLIGPELKPISDKNRVDFIEKIQKSLYMGKVISYAQGFQQLKAASEKYNWNLIYSEIARIFQDGCIIRAQLLKKITESYVEKNDISNLILAPYFKDIINKYQYALREIVSYAVQNGIPIPALYSAISYYDSYRSEVLPANLIQAQRDYFGSHTYQRIDKEGIFHSKWVSTP